MKFIEQLIKDEFYFETIPMVENPYSFWEIHWDTGDALKSRMYTIDGEYVIE